MSRAAARSLLLLAVAHLVAGSLLPGYGKVELASPVGGLLQYALGGGDGCPWGRQHICHDLDPRSECAVSLESEVLTVAEADSIIAEAEGYATENGWTTRRHAAAPTTDLPHHVLPAVWPLLNRTLDRVTSGAFARCGLERGMDGLDVQDLFVVKYSPSGQPGLRKHLDGSFMSFNLHLSSPGDHEGGGTHFTGLDKTFKIPKGSVLMHGGSVEHTGVDVTSGVRYIVVGFLGSKKGCCVTGREWRGAWLKRSFAAEPGGHGHASDSHHVLAVRAILGFAIIVVGGFALLVHQLVGFLVSQMKRAWPHASKTSCD